VQGDFTLRGVTKAEALSPRLLAETAEECKGTMDFDRKNYGRNSGIPFFKIADRVGVTVNLTARRVKAIAEVKKGKWLQTLAFGCFEPPCYFWQCHVPSMTDIL